MGWDEKDDPCPDCIRRVNGDWCFHKSCVVINKCHGAALCFRNEWRYDEKENRYLLIKGRRAIKG